MATWAYTRAGDGGQSTLFGKKLPKTAIEFEAFGALDELNAFLGFCKIACSAKVKTILEKIQRELFILGSDLATPLNRKTERISEKHIKEMERTIDELVQELPPIKHFVIPGGSEGSARLQITRAVARRAERRVLMLRAKRKINPQIAPYLNRLSSLLFVLARYENINSKIKEEFWP
jgi:cob(I)alamin adenosyltransferase